MFGIRINGNHSYKNHNLRCLGYQLSSPEPIYATVSVPGMDGAYDITEAVYGRVTYKNRSLTAEFECQELTRAAHQTVCAYLDSLYHGKLGDIVLDSDPNHYLRGRLKLEHEHTGIYGSHRITVNCDPYRYNTGLTAKSFVVAGSLAVNLQNAKMPVCPTITASQTGMEITYGSRRYSLAKGTVLMAQITLVEGSNPLTLHGNGQVTIEYREGVL